MIYAEILAGGKGTRMGNTEKPKQFLMIADKPVLIHTIEQFILNSRINKIIVCCPEEWINYTKDIIKKYIIDDTMIDVVIGGSDRNETIINGCNHIEKEYGLTSDDIIITHDAVRPFISQRIINDNIEAMKTCDATDTVIPATDTIVSSLDGENLNEIPNRANLYQGQTPQSFKIIELMNLYNNLTEDEKKILTDACKIYVIKGKNVKIVMGEVYNMKITTRYDIKLANAIVAGDTIK